MTAAPTWTSRAVVVQVQRCGTWPPLNSITPNADATSQCAARSVFENRRTLAMTVRSMLPWSA
jgi:hypothetical protein